LGRAAGNARRFGAALGCSSRSTCTTLAAGPDVAVRVVEQEGTRGVVALDGPTGGERRPGYVDERQGANVATSGHG
jgi:hypothetical protein